MFLPWRKVFEENELFDTVGQSLLGVRGESCFHKPVEVIAGEDASSASLDAFCVLFIVDVEMNFAAQTRAVDFRAWMKTRSAFMPFVFQRKNVADPVELVDVRLVQKDHIIDDILDKLSFEALAASDVKKPFFK